MISYYTCSGRCQMAQGVGLCRTVGWHAGRGFPVAASPGDPANGVPAGQNAVFVISQHLPTTRNTLRHSLWPAPRSAPSNSATIPRTLPATPAIFWPSPGAGPCRSPLHKATARLLQIPVIVVVPMIRHVFAELYGVSGADGKRWRVRGNAAEPLRWTIRPRHWRRQCTLRNRNSVALALGAADRQ